MRLDELNNDGNSNEKEQPFIPTVQQEETKDEFMPTVEQEEIQETVVKPKNSFSMVSGKQKPVEDSGERVKADFSDLPQSSYEGLGVDIKESMEKEILGPGGDFEKYIAEKTKEVLAYNEQIDLENEMGKTDENKSEESEEEISDEDEIEKELASEESQVKYNRKEIKFDDEEEDSEVENARTDEGYFEENNEDLKETIEEEVEDDIEEVESDATDEDPIELQRSTHKIEVNESEVLDEDEVEVNEDEIEEDELSNDQRVALMKKMVTEKIRPVSKRFDISGYTIAKKGTSSVNVFANSEVSTAKWVLPNTGVVVEMKEISGAELDKIRMFANSGDARNVLQIIYNAIVSPKPTSFEAWLKSVAFSDYDHLFMAIYIAAFADSNYLPGDCENKQCKEKMYVTDNIPIMDMVKFADDKAKEKFKKIMKENTTNPTGVYATEVVAISEQCAISFKIPSLYSVYIESSYLDDEFTRKYSDMVTLLPYIDAVYKIDQNEKTLIPVEYKQYTNNMAKTIKSKVIYYNKALSSLTIDEITVLKAYINNINENSANITYRIPETTCPYCGHVNPATENQSASSLVFLRNQLALLVTT